MNSRTQLIAGLVLVAILAVLGFAAFAINRGALTFKNGLPRLSVSTLTRAGQPSLERPVNYPADFPEEAKKQYEESRAKAIEAIQSDPTQAAAWFDLAIQYRIVGDHEGAVEIWEYVSKLYPSDGISLHNIAEYYFHNEKEYRKAEDYYMRSIEKMPNLAQNYADLFDMYRYVYKTDTSAAVDIVKKGMLAVTEGEAADFSIMLGAYYQEKGDIALARASFQQARAIALELKNQSLIRRIDQLLAELD